MNIADAVAQACIDVFMSLPQGGGKPHPRSNGRYAFYTLISGLNGPYCPVWFCNWTRMSSYLSPWPQASSVLPTTNCPSMVILYMTVMPKC